MRLPKGSLYHYTDPAGALGIIGAPKPSGREGCIWLSEIQFMNDGREWWQARDVKLSMLQGLAFDGDPVLKTYAEQHLRTLGDLRTQPSAPWPRFYVFSMSKHEDRLSQWRGYCRNGGYCIQFSPNKLAALAKLHGFELRQCLYTRQKQDRLVAALIDRIRADIADQRVRPRPAGLPPGAPTNFRLATAAAPPPPPRPAIDPVLASAIATVDFEFQKMATYFKHDSFSEEAEWRLVGEVRRDDPRVRWRARGPMIVPYVELKLPSDDRSPITHIQAGPGKDAELAVCSLQALLLGTSIKSSRTASSLKDLNF